MGRGTVEATDKAHNLEAAGSIPAPATNPDSSNGRTRGFGPRNPRSSRGSGAKQRLPGQPCESHGRTFCPECFP